MSKWIRKDDQVVVIAGNDKGKSGKVLLRNQQRVVVQGVNIRKKHLKRTQQMQTAQIVEMEMPIHISNVSFCDPSGKPLKVKIRKNDKGVKELFYIDKNKEILLREVK